MDQKRENTQQEKAKLVAVNLRALQAAKGHLETSIHDLGMRLPYSVDTILGLSRDMDHHLQSAVDWAEELAGGQ